MSKIDPIRLVHSTTDLHRAHLIIERIIECPFHDDKRLKVLEAAFLADYQRPFIGLADHSAPLQLEGFGSILTAAQIGLHTRLLQLAGRRAQERTHEKSERIKEWALFEDEPLQPISELVKTLRGVISDALYIVSRSEQPAHSPSA